MQSTDERVTFQLARLVTDLMTVLFKVHLLIWISNTPWHGNYISQARIKIFFICQI